MPSSETCLKSSPNEKEEENGDNVPVQRASFIESSDSMSEIPLQSDSLTSDSAMGKFEPRERERQISNCINNDNNNESSYSPKYEKMEEPNREMTVLKEEEEEGEEEMDQSRRRSTDLKDPSKRNGFKSYLNHSPASHSLIPGQSWTKTYRWSGKKVTGRCTIFLFCSDVTEEESIRGYLNRSDTAVIFPEPVNNKDNVSSCNKRTGGSRFNPTGDSITVSRIGESQWSWWWWWQWSRSLKAGREERKLFLLSPLIENRSNRMLSWPGNLLMSGTQSGGCTFLRFKLSFLLCSSFDMNCSWSLMWTQQLQQPFQMQDRRIEEWWRAGCSSWAGLILCVTRHSTHPFIQFSFFNPPSLSVTITSHWGTRKGTRHNHQLLLLISLSSPFPRLFLPLSPSPSHSKLKAFISYHLWLTIIRVSFLGYLWICIASTTTRITWFLMRILSGFFCVAHRTNSLFPFADDLLQPFFVENAISGRDPQFLYFVSMNFLLICEIQESDREKRCTPTEAAQRPAINWG